MQILFFIHILKLLVCSIFIFTYYYSEFHHSIWCVWRLIFFFLKSLEYLILSNLNQSIYFSTLSFFHFSCIPCSFYLCYESAICVALTWELGRNFETVWDEWKWICPASVPVLIKCIEWTLPFAVNRWMITLGNSSFISREEHVPWGCCAIFKKWYLTLLQAICCLKELISTVVVHHSMLCFQC